MPSPPNSQGTLPFAPIAATAALASSRAESPTHARARRLGSGAAYITLAVAGFSTVNLFVVLGLPALAFLVISHGDLDIFLNQLNNLTSRYVAADAARQAGFRHFVQIIAAILTAAIFALRLPAFVRSVRRELSPEERP